MLIERTRTEKQIEASRANGRRSQGPVTAMGKAISSRNAVKHGFRSKDVRELLLNPERLAEIVREHALELDPQTPEETLLVEELAAARCRVETVWAMLTSAPADQQREQLLRARLRFGADYVKSVSKLFALRRGR